MNRQTYLGVKTIAAVIVGLMLNAPAQADFSSATATSIVSYDAPSASGTATYLLRFQLPPNVSVNPDQVPAQISAAPASGNAAGTPTFVVSIPAGCFVDSGNHFSYKVSGTSCSPGTVSVTLENAGVPVNVSSFDALVVRSPTTGRGFMKVVIGFSGFFPTAVANPFLNVSLGAEGITNLPMGGKVITRGSTP